jgi:CBS domain-containing protein
MTKVSGEMTLKVMFALETDSLDDVWNTMIALGVRHVPVVRDQKLVGILSDRDFLRFAKQRKGGQLCIPHRSVGEVMTKDVVTCCVSDTIGKVAGILVERKIDALPVVDNSRKLIGIITSTDLLRLLRQRDGIALRELPLQWEPEALLSTGWRPAVAQ